MFSGSALTPSVERAAAVERAWAQLNDSGPSLSSTERQFVISDARRAWAGAAEPLPESGLIGEATHWIAVDAEGITEPLVASFEERGLDRLTYLEIVGVVARLANIDWYLRAIGAELPSLPDDDGRSPTNMIQVQAQITDSWVPMMGDAMAPRTLDALPEEGTALVDLHEPMYIPMMRIGAYSIDDELTRVQTEFIASRVSYLNECFY